MNHGVSLVRHRRWYVALVSTSWISLGMPMWMSPTLHAQTPTLHRVEGVAYDSLSKQPLSGAFIAVAGTGRSTTSDSKGKFRLDSVPEGERQFTMQHAAFDSLGLSGAMVRVRVAKNMPRVVLAVPAFETLWRAACGAAPAPRDSALVYGTVRDAGTASTLASAVVEVSWIELVGGGKSLANVGQRRWRRAVTADANGEYAICGAPAATALTLRIAADSLQWRDSLAITSIELEATANRVQRRDVLASTQRASAQQSAGTDASTASNTDALSGGGAATGPVGVVVGTVTTTDGAPIPNATVAIDGTSEVRTGADGRFRLANVEPGTKQLAIVAIGMKPNTLAVNVFAGDTTRVIVPMTSVQTLAEVNVRAKANTVAGMRELSYEDHKRMGLGAFRDSSVITQAQSMVGALRSVAGLQVRGTPYRPTISSVACPALRTVIDGHPVPVEELALIDHKLVAAMEIYTRNSAPMDVPGSRGCLIVVWTKAALGK